MKAALTPKRALLALAPYLGALALVALVAPFIGGEPVSLARVLHDAGAPKADWSIDTLILLDQRIPRVLLAILVGGCLALVGCVFQVILRNSLATPYTLGVTGGASVGAYLAIAWPTLAFSLGPFSSVQLAALAGALAVLAIIYALARRPAGTSMNTLLLAGVTVGILCSAIVLAIRYLASPDVLLTMDRWLMGGLDIIGYRQLLALAPLLLPGLVLLAAELPALNHLALGEDLAHGHGVDVPATQRRILLGGALLTAGAVSLAGPIGFVGLLVPHVVRRLSGLDHRIVAPAAFLAGAAFLAACDTAARTIVAPTEVPVGIFTALIGGPVFIALLLRRQ